MTEIRLKNVHKAYGNVEVIHGIDLHVESGEFVVFVGPSGCGKSTLLRIIAGLEKVTGGEVLIDGDVVNAIPASERGLAMVFQSYALYPHMSVYKNMAFGLENSRMPRAEIDSRVNQAAAMLQITDYLHRRPKQLSGGQRQRVAIGRAIVRDPKAFLFDEPLSNLDAELRVAMRKELAALHGKLGGTMIYVTHDQIEAMTLADQIVLLKDGSIEQQGAPLDLFERPNNLFVAGFLGSPSMNLIEVSPLGRDNLVQLADSQTLAVDPAMHARLVETKDPILWGVRPEHFAHVENATNAVMVEIGVLQPTGSRSYASFRIADTHVVAELPAHTVSKEGQRIALSPNMEKTHFFNAGTGERIG